MDNIGRPICVNEGGFYPHSIGLIALFTLKSYLMSKRGIMMYIPSSLGGLLD